jgi:hypothetical protein
MPRIVVNVGDGEAAKVAGIQVQAILLRGKGRRLRVVIDIPPGWPHFSAVPNRPIKLSTVQPMEAGDRAIHSDDAA